MATIKEVAKKAGVAISTVSAVINRSAPVSDETAERVQSAIAATAYVPHGGARSLRSGQSRMIGLIVPDIVNPYFAASARAIENYCLEAGYMSVVSSSGQDAARESQLLGMMRSERVAGLIIIPTRSDAAHGARLKREIHVPTVLLDMYIDALPFDVVKVENVEVGRLATEHLIGLGHRRIALLCGLPGLATSEDRLTGYKEAHRAAELSIDQDLLLRGDFDAEIAQHSVAGAFRGPNPPTAIVALSTMMTTGAMMAARQLDLNIPGDVSLVGVDDFHFAEIMSPPPTVVAAPVEEMAVAAISRLMGEIKKDLQATGARQIYHPKLIERASTRRIVVDA